MLKEKERVKWVVIFYLFPKPELNKMSNIIKITLPTLVILFLFLEIIFRFSPIIPDELPWNIRANDKLLTFNPKEKSSGIFLVENQIKHWKLNNQGWVSHIDYDTVKTKYRICIIGDSFVEALQVNTGKAFHSLLHEELKDSVDVYGIGTSGAPLSQYLYLAEYTVKKFKPDLLIFNIIHNDFLESIYELNPNRNNFFWTFKKTASDKWVPISPIPSKKSESILASIKKILGVYSKVYCVLRYYKHRIIQISKLNKQQHIFKANFEQIDSLKNEKGYVANIDVKSILLHQKDITLITNYILKEINKKFPRIKKLFVMNATKALVYNQQQEKIPILNDLMAKSCEAYHLDFLDITPYFQKNYLENKTRFDFKSDIHWNEYGHKVVSEIILQFLVEKKLLKYSNKE